MKNGGKMYGRSKQREETRQDVVLEDRQKRNMG
jgi:hypothetical protein